jgi:hypothetical protein
MVQGGSRFFALPEGMLPLPRRPARLGPLARLFTAPFKNYGVTNAPELYIWGRNLTAVLGPRMFDRRVVLLAVLALACCAFFLELRLNAEHYRRGRGTEPSVSRRRKRRTACIVALGSGATSSGEGGQRGHQPGGADVLHPGAEAGGQRREPDGAEPRRRPSPGTNTASPRHNVARSGLLWLAPQL